MRHLNLVPVLIAALVAACIAAGPRAGAQSAEELAKTEQAMPAAPRTAPKAPRKLLVFNLCRGFVHSAVPYGAKTLEIMGAKTGAFEVTQSDDIAMFEPERLRQFDAVCMNNTTGELFLPANMGELSQEEQRAARERDAALKQSLLDFVRGGKGIIGIHAATDCFYEWADYGEMMGGYFDGHPWNEEVGVKLDDPAHPVVAAFRGRPFRVADEIYQFRDPYSRERLRVLLSLDVSRTDMTKKGIRRDDDDFAVSWVRGYGEGRVFYCSLGHREDIFWNPAILQHYLDGVQFALGDLEADVTPSAGLSDAYLRESRLTMLDTALDDLLTDLAGYEIGQDRASLTDIERMVHDAHGDPAAEAILARRLAALLGTAAPFHAKQFACRMLFRLGVEEVIPAVAPLLADDTLSDIARYALERLESPAVDAAYASALARASDGTRVGLLNGLGERGARRTVGPVASFLTHDDPAVAGAAMKALGRIGGPEAASALTRARGGCPPELMETFAHAYLACADSLSADGEIAGAVAIYEAMYAAGDPKPVRMAALRGLAAARGADALDLLFSVMKENDAAMRALAVDLTRGIPGPDTSRALAERLPALPATAQPLLLTVLADRGDNVALPAVTQAAASGDPAVKTAALSALAMLGDDASAALLAGEAAREGEHRAVARNALARLRGAAIEPAILRLLEEAENPVRVEAARALGARNAVTAVPALMRSARQPDAAVRTASYEALAILTPGDALPGLLELLAGADDEVRDAAEAATLTTMLRIADTSHRAGPFLAALESEALTIAGRRSLLHVLGQSGDDAALDALRGALASDDAGLRDVAVRALAAWPNPTPLADLLPLAENADDGAHRTLALRGFVRMLDLPSARPPEETLEYFRRAAALAASAEDKTLVLSGLGKMGHPDGVALVQQYLDDEEVKEEAALALSRIQSAHYAVTASVNSEAAGNAVDGDPATRWDTGGAQSPGQWFQVDLGWPHRVTRVVLDCAASANDYPRGYAVYVTDNPDALGEPVATGEGAGAVVEIACDPKTGRFLRIVQTGATDVWFWSIHELTVESE